MIISTQRTYESIDLTQPVPKRSSRRTKRKSSAWTEMRHNHLAVYPECRVCGATDAVVVHHLRYRGKRGESERPGDLITLCEFHHNELHRVVGSGPLVEGTLNFLRLRRRH